MKVFIISLFLIANSYANTEAQEAGLGLVNVTKDWEFRGQTISAFPKAIKRLNLKENFEVYRIYHFQDPIDQKTVRVELFFTGDDAEFYPQFYIFTNARNGKSIVHSSSSFQFSVYYLADLSSPDLELGELAPLLDPFKMTEKEIKRYIASKVFNNNGLIRSNQTANCPRYLMNLDYNNLDCRRY